MGPAMSILLNEAMGIERSGALNAQPWEAGKHYLNMNDQCPHQNFYRRKIALPIYRDSEMIPIFPINCKQRCVKPFTLIELLLVIAIIAILSALMLPAVMESKTTSYRIACTNNLHMTGLALTVYAMDYGMFPLGNDLIAGLRAEGYLGVDSDFHCPMDSSVNANTYSLGFIGGHPRTVQDNDPLVVCGWHGRVGTIAVFSDTAVSDMNVRDGGDTLPVTMQLDGDDVNPGLTLQTSPPLTVTSANGQQAIVNGANGTTLVSATYDPLANGGAGAFNMVFDVSSPIGTASGTVHSSTGAYIDFYTRFQYCTARSTVQPGPTGAFSYGPGSPNVLTIVASSAYRVTHRVSGKTFTSNDIVPSVTFHSSSTYLSKQ
jgi:prepilin-type N-terminal cleavage/methylation domain-containing protein